MPRASVVWINTHVLGRALDRARQTPGEPADLLGAERAYAARLDPGWRFTMLIRHGFLDVIRLIPKHSRHKAYAFQAFVELLGRADDHGALSFEVDELAAELSIPRRCLYSVLIDLEREPVAAITRVMKGRHVRGVQLTAKVHRPPAPRPGRRRPAPAIASRARAA